MASDPKCINALDRIVGGAIDAYTLAPNDPDDKRDAVRRTIALEFAAAEAAAAREAVERCADYVAECFAALGLPLGVESIRVLAPPPPGALDRVRQAARAEGMEAERAEWVAALDRAAGKIKASKTNTEIAKTAMRGVIYERNAAIRAAKGHV